MKKVFGTIAILSFLFLLGTVGSVEQDMIPLGTGVVRMVFSLVSFTVFIWLAGGFNDSYTFDENEESRPRRSRPKGGKRKSSKTEYHKGGRNATLQQ